jgi:hypothetical protein
MSLWDNSKTESMQPKADTKLKRKREHVVGTMTTAVGQGKRRAATETAISKGKQRAAASDGIAGSSTMLLVSLSIHILKA